MKNVLSASAGESGGEAFETCCTSGGHGRFAGELWYPSVVTDAAHRNSGSHRVRFSDISESSRWCRIRRMQRREFLSATTLGLLGLAADEPIVDIHQHAGYLGRSDAALVAH